MTEIRFEDEGPIRTHLHTVDEIPAGFLYRLLFRISGGKLKNKTHMTIILTGVAVVLIVLAYRTLASDSDQIRPLSSPHYPETLKP